MLCLQRRPKQENKKENGGEMTAPQALTSLAVVRQNSPRRKPVQHLPLVADTETPYLRHLPQRRHRSLPPVLQPTNAHVASNATATRQYNAQQLNAMASNPGGSYMPTQSMVNGQSFRPEVAQGSCLGGEASYFLTREQPTLHDFQRLFPDYAPGDFVLTYPMDAPTHSYNQMNNISVPPDDTYVTQMPMSMDPLPEFQHFESHAFEDMAFLDQPLNFTFGDADVTTFGSQPLPSPDILQSPTHLPLSHHRNNSRPLEAQECAHIIPPDIPTSQTINPNVFQPRIPYSSQAHFTLHSAPSSAPTENTDQDLFLQRTLATPPKGTQFDMSAPLPNFPGVQAFKYRPPPPLINPLSSPEP